METKTDVEKIRLGWVKYYTELGLTTNEVKEAVKESMKLEKYINNNLKVVSEI